MNGGPPPVTLAGHRIWMTGATGGIGRRLLPALREHGAEVVVAGRGVSVARLADEGRVQTVAFDLEDPVIPAGAMSGADAVCHLAAHVPGDMSDPGEAEACLRRNALATLELLRAADAAGVETFIYFSSGQIYVRSPRPVRESDPVYPAARAPYYLASKLAAEVFVTHYGSTGRLKTAILRVASVYGPGTRQDGLVPRFIRQVRAKQPIVLNDGGRYQADFVYVDDVVGAVIQALGRRSAGIFNIGSGAPASIHEVAREVLRLCGGDESLLSLAAGRSDPGFAALDISRARSDLGYTPTPLVEGLENTVLHDA